MSQPILSARAEDDLLSIKCYYLENRSAMAAAKVLESLAQGVAYVGEYPSACRRVESRIVCKSGGTQA